VRDHTETADVLLVGGGVASLRCARQLRRDGFQGRIVVVSDEPIPPYNRPPLSKELLRHDLPDDLVLAEPERWYERRAVELRTGRRVVALDLGAQEASLDDGTRIRFERCLLATGAEPRALPAPGGEHALLLRTLPDARRLREAATAAGKSAPVVVVGGGLIGLEVASSLAALGLRPTVVELSDRLWSGSLGVELSE
jgi:3-phenylpropionate/trans-cinnamate dioxygenase ferredoxin reductase subunit